MSEQREILFFDVHICFYTVTNSLTIAVTVLSALCEKERVIGQFPGSQQLSRWFHGLRSTLSSLLQPFLAFIYLFFTFLYHVSSVHLSVSHLSHTATDGQLHCLRVRD